MIWHDETGAGRPVLLLHAGVADARMWERERAAWSDRLAVVRCDLPGYGRSPIPADGVLAPARSVVDLLEARAVGAAAVVGASFGGRVALEVAAARPDLVSRLLLVAPALPDHDWSAAVRAFGEAEDAALEAGDLERAVELNLEAWVAGPTRTLAQAPADVVERVRAMQRHAFELALPRLAELDVADLVPDLAARLPLLAQPTLVVTGDLDQPDFAAIADRLVATLPDAARARIPGAAHLPSMERPEAFDAVALPFLLAGAAP